MSLIDDLASAIARFEGYNDPASLAARNNNPGNLRSWGSYPVVNGYVQFPDAASGWAALKRQVSLNIGRGLNLFEFFGGKPGVYGGYAPSSDGNAPTNYARTVASWLGISTDEPLSEISPGQSSPAAFSPELPALEIPGLPTALPEWVPLAAVAIGAVSVAFLIWDR